MQPRSIVINSDFSRHTAINAIKNLPIIENQLFEVVIRVYEEKRISQQNKAQWPILNAIAAQVLWPVNGAMTRITGDDFKQILTAAYRKEQARVAQGIDGNMVLLGHRTREFKRKEWNDWLEFLLWFCAEKNVKIPLSKRDQEKYNLSKCP